MDMEKTSPIVIALTGGIGSGKSSVSKLFAEWGAAVVDADQLSREVVTPDSEGLRAVVKRFGADVLQPNNTLNRQRLAQIVFNDPKARADLEQILHPLIRQLWLSTLAALQEAAQHPAIVYAVPLLFESKHSYPEVEKVVVVTCPEDIRISRICSRDNIPAEAARARIASQLTDQEKVKRSDFVISNDGSIADLTVRARSVWDKIT
jgi:dephospho-CoA kinase